MKKSTLREYKASLEDELKVYKDKLAVLKSNSENLSKDGIFDLAYCMAKVDTLEKAIHNVYCALTNSTVESELEVDALLGRYGYDNIAKMNSDRWFEGKFVPNGTLEINSIDKGKIFGKVVIGKQLPEECYDLMTLDQFLDDVESGSLMDDDGVISEIYINGFRCTNICHESFGRYETVDLFLSTEEFRDLGQLYDIRIDWANK